MIAAYLLVYITAPYRQQCCARSFAVYGAFATFTLLYFRTLTRPQLRITETCLMQLDGDIHLCHQSIAMFDHRHPTNDDVCALCFWS